MFIRRKYGRYYFIYKTINLINDKIYVGQRITKNINDGYLGSGNIFKRSLIKYGKENFYREILEFCQDKEHLNNQEIYWISELDARNPIIGYNIGRGGGCPNIEHQSEESNNKRRDKLKGRIITWGYKVSKTLTGHVNSKEAMEKQSKTKSTKEYKEKHKDVYYTRPMVTCPHCDFQSRSYGMMSRWHFDNCKQNPNYINIEHYVVSDDIKERTRKTHKNKPVETCPYCGYQGNSHGAMVYWHFENCKENSNRDITKDEIEKEGTEKQKKSYYKRPLEVCVYCGYESRNAGVMKKHHFDNCKHKQKIA
jgi:group I intron endonuclease